MFMTALIILLIIAGIVISVLSLSVHHKNQEIESTNCKIHDLEKKLSAPSEEIQAMKEKLAVEFDKAKENLSIEFDKYSQKKAELEIMKSRTLAIKEHYTNLVNDFDKFVKEKVEAFPYLAKAMADYLTIQYEKSAQVLERKRNPAIIEALRIRELQEKTQKIIEEKKLLDYELYAIKELFPDIDSYFKNKDRFNDILMLSSHDRRALLFSKKFTVARFSDEVYRDLSSCYNIADFFDSINNGRLNNAFNSSLTVKNLFFSADIHSSGNVYRNTTLRECDCEDFSRTKKPCKHMLFLAYTLGLLQMNREMIEKRHSASLKKLSNIAQETEKEDKKLAHLRTKSKELSIAISQAENNFSLLNSTIENFLTEKASLFPSMAAFVTDLLTMHYEDAAHILETKKTPAKVEAKRIRELKRETAEILRKKKEYEYKLAYIEKLFPNITDIFDEDFNAYDDFELETEETTDRVRLFLSPEEYSSLSTTEKNQLALDRYVEQRKSKWQVGRDYEMYVGHRLEARGFKVKYTGIIENLEDMGRDLIASSGRITYIVQCKNWSQEKTIHEKHIFQLYGTVVLWKLDNPFFEVKGVFITTTQLSEKAKAVADELGIHVVEYLPIDEFPRIKCNANRTTGEKIYHLPFDQQYDTAVIEEKNGECYAYTVAEAEEKGFRRAWRHFSN